MLETFEDRVSSLEDRVSSLEKQGFLEYAKTRKGFEETIYFSKEKQYSTAHTYSKVQVFCVDRYRMKTFDQKIADFMRQLVFKTKSRPAVDDGNLPVNADSLLRSEPVAKLLK